MAVFKVTDENGKDFTGNFNLITDINGDVVDNQNQSVGMTTDAKREKVAVVHDIEYVNQKGETIDNYKLLADIAEGKSNIIALDLNIEATHSGKNLNNVIYYADSMEKDAETFINPFRKPMLKNHNSYNGEPLGRIIQAWHGDSQLTDERTAIHLKARITDQETFAKFLDGRYSTVSIGGSMNTVTCNICGKTILKDGKFKFCGHWRGETYKDQVCYWGGRDITYHEVSTVNSPADMYAQIMKVTVITESDNKKEDSYQGKENNNMGDNNKGNANDIMEQLNKLSSMIDSIATQSNKNASDATTTDNNNQSQNETNEASQTTDTIETVKAQLEDAKKENETLKTQLEDAKNKAEIAQTALAAAQDECNNYKETCLTLAAANKELIADTIISKEIANGALEDANKDSRKQELVAMSMKDLMAVKPKEKTEDTQQQQRQPASVTSPVQVNNNSNGTTTDANKETNNNAKKTVDDFADDIIGKIMK